jgi:excisionase family DNA binding protein
MHSESRKITNKQRLTPSEAAEYLGLSPATLDTWRSTKRYALPYVKAGGRVQYYASDLDAFLESRKVRPALVTR